MVEVNKEREERKIERALDDMFPDRKDAPTQVGAACCDGQAKHNSERSGLKRPGAKLGIRVPFTASHFIVS